uniref:RNA exonuclease 1 homolog n=1 Tax=Culex pipiens TaxID=7175 RepID=A0A8D8KFD4_CULPI
MSLELILVVAAVVALFGFVLFVRTRMREKNDASNRNEKNEDRKQKHGTRTPTAGNEAAASGGAPAPAGKTGGGGRKVAVSSISTNVKKQRTADANYQHPWLYTTLKGHTGQVFDMDFSRNGKYLATCAEDSPSAQSSNGNHLINVNINANDERNTSAATTTTSSAFGDVNDVVSSSSSSSNASSGSTSSGSSTRGEDSPNAPGAGKKQRKYTKKKQQYKKSNGNNGSSNSSSAGNCATNLRVCGGDDDPIGTDPKVVTSPVKSTPVAATVVAQSASSSSLSSSSSTGSSSSGGKQQQHHHRQHEKNSSYQGRLDFNGGRTSPQRGDNSKRYHQRNAGLSPLRQYVKLNLSENELVKYLSKYVLDKDVMKELGFPVEYGLDSDKAIIYKFAHDFFRPAAAQFYPRSVASSKKRSHEIVEADKSDDTDSGHSSPTNVDDSDSLLVYRSLSQGNSTALKSPLSDIDIEPSEERECCRCNKGFFITLDGEYLTQEHCIYHWGRLTRVFSGAEFKKVYSCCNGDADVKGCTINKLHVWTGLLPGFNGPFDGFVKTQPSPRKLKLFEKLLLNKFYYQNMNADCIDLLQQDDLIVDDSESDGVYALDCEMSYTGRGLELTKVTVVSVDGQLVYERLVKPDIEIVDYNTRYSGVTEADFANPRQFVTLRQVQRDLLKFIYDDTILIGHAIENDLKVLKIIHKTVIDTSITFPHMNGFPFRQSLKSLTKNILKRDIQMQQQQQEQPVYDKSSSRSSSTISSSNSIGHCSLEDSRASLELMLWRVRKDKAVYDNIWNNNNCYRMQNN